MNVTSTKKLDKALLRAVEAAEAVVKDSRDTHTGDAYASAEAVFDEGRRALSGAGLVLVPVDWATEKFRGIDHLVRVVELRHVKSGESRELRSPPYFPEHGGNIGGIATRSLRYLVRDLLLLPSEEPAELVMPTREQVEALQRLSGHDRPDRQPREETEEQVRSDIEALLLSTSTEAEAWARRFCARAETLDEWKHIRDTLLMHEETRESAKNNAQAAGNGSAPPPGLEPPAVLGDPDEAPTAMELALGGRLPDTSLDVAEGGEGEAPSAAVLQPTDAESSPPEAPQGTDSTVEVQPCPEQERREGAPQRPVKQADVVDPLPSGSEPPCEHPEEERLRDAQNGVEICGACRTTIGVPAESLSISGVNPSDFLDDDEF